MINRKILYGYQIRDGALVIVPEEQQTIRMAFTLYIAGTSYQAVADALNHQNIPYCPEAPLWDKHKVKRLLENPRYTGKDGFPAAVDAIAIGTRNFVPHKIYDNIFLGLFNRRAFEFCCTGQAFGVIFTVDFLTVPESVGLHCIQVGFLDQSGTVCIGGTGRGNCCDCFP